MIGLQLKQVGQYRAVVARANKANRQQPLSSKGKLSWRLPSPLQAAEVVADQAMDIPQVQVEKKPYVIITSLGMKGEMEHDRFLQLAKSVFKQLESCQGLVEWKVDKLGEYEYITMTAWDTYTSAVKFSKSGAHGIAWRATAQIATHGKTYMAEFDSIPDIEACKGLLGQVQDQRKY